MNCPKYYAVVGNPNSGKTTLFNSLTGLRQKVGNYPGVTVEKKLGHFIGQHGEKIELLDLPGSYSLSAHAPDERVTRDVLLGLRTDTPRPERLLCVIDASHLERNLYFITQVLELGLPTIIALNMIDLAETQGIAIDALQLSQELGVPVIPIQAHRSETLLPLRLALSRAEIGRSFWSPKLPSAWERAIDGVAALWSENLSSKSTDATNNGVAPVLASSSMSLYTAVLRAGAPGSSLASATFKTGSEHEDASLPRDPLVRTKSMILLAAPEAELELLAMEMKAGCALGVALAQRAMLDRELPSWREELVSARYQRISELCQAAQGRTSMVSDQWTQRLDEVLTHPVWGWMGFLGMMGFMFVSIFFIAAYPKDWIEQGFEWLGSLATALLPPGDLSDLLSNGVLAGIGGVIVFLPQILILFFFIGLLEDTGYMARAAFLMDRVMSKVGLHGKSFIPLLSSYACAIPGIMATRTIENTKDRLVTILVAPLMTCSARLPVYALMIEALFPSGSIWTKGAMMMGLYLLGTLMALFFAWFFKKTLLRGETPIFLMELPPYRRPALKQIALQMLHRSNLFLKRAGTVILGISILLWFVASFPKKSSETSLNKGAQLEQSYAGRLGHLIEPAIAPLGFDWKIGIGLVAAQAAREVFVSTLSIIYHVEGGEYETNENKSAFSKTLLQQKHPNGAPVYTPLTCLSILVFFALSMQCISTLAVVYRETNSWRWPLFQFCYMTGTAYVVCWLLYQGGRLLGFA